MKMTRSMHLVLVSVCVVWAVVVGPLFPVHAAPTGVRPSTVSMAMIFDYHVPPKQLEHDEVAANVGYVWGANSPELPGGSARHDYYAAWAQGWCPGRGLSTRCPKGGPPSFPWLKKHHPSWILWRTNKKGVPTVPARSRPNPGPIVDFTNPAVQQYWIQHYIAPYLKLGFTGIGWDNPLVYDPYGAVGHYSIRHHFVRQYRGTLQDGSWVRAQTKALGAFLRRARAIDPKAKFALNTNFDCLYAKMASWAMPLRYVDTIVDEQGYSFWGPRKYNYIPAGPGTYCANRWLAKTDAFIRMQKAGKRVVLINEEPYRVHAFMTNTNRRARRDLQWVLANYLLVKYSHTYFWFGGVQQYGYPVFEQREEMVDLGKPRGDMRPSQGVYVRFFTKGMALVNPSPTKWFTVSLGNGTYKTLYGQNVNSVTMSPHSGLVLALRH